MQIRNNQQFGPKPNDSTKNLDPDLTKVNREGIEQTSTTGRERTREAQAEQSARQAELQCSSLSRESVELSSESRQLAAEELPGRGGVAESVEARSERIDALKEEHRSGSLNTTERARESAGRLLGGE